MNRLPRRLRLRGHATSVPEQAVILPAVREQTRPRLRIYRGSPDWWCWDLDHGDGTGQGAAHESWGQALAVGLAALEAASVRAHEPSPGWERIHP